MAGYRQLECEVDGRRAAVLATTGADALDGIDYLEVSAVDLDSQRFLHVHFLREILGDGPPAGLAGNPGAFRLTGGVRERGIRILAVTPQDQHLVVEVDRAGDFSTYTLEIPDHPGLDPAFRAVEFSFKAGCPSRFDCRPLEICPPEEAPEPVIDYLARDYASFRRALIDLIPTLVPEWTDRHEADLGMTLVELMAYAGDHLSYQLDAIANELHLESARRRVSVRRHARLLDYSMHDGASARTFLHFEAAGAGTIPVRTRVLGRIEVPLDTRMPPHGALIPTEVAELALAATDVVFETLGETRAHEQDGVPVDPRLNGIPLHPWSDEECCLPRGATEIYLEGDLVGVLREHDFLLFEEVLGPVTGERADADPAHRQVVRLIAVEAAEDPLAENTASPGDPLPLTRVTWHEEDALAFPLCVSTQDQTGALIEGISIARGNLVLADHGLPMEEVVDGFHAGPPPGRPLAPRIRLREGPLSFRVLSAAAEGTRPSVAALRETDPTLASPEVKGLEIDGSEWTPRRHLIGSDAFDQVFAVETDDRGRAVLRFGNGEFGRRPPTGQQISVRYRIGIGTPGNAGADSLVHVIQDPVLPPLNSLRNPLSAWGGIDPEPIERVKQLAPPAMHAVQFRAVTEEDYARAAEKCPGVAKARATFRWTGSWHTVFVTIDRCGGREVTPAFENTVRGHLERSRLAGYDLQVDGPRYVPLEIEIEVCAAPGHFRGHVAEALERALSARDLPGRRRGFFHSDGLTFGQTLYLSRLYAAIEAVEGVSSADLRVFRRWGTADVEALDVGYMTFGRLEIPRLDNDPNFPENGVLRIDVRGGK